MEKIYVVIVTFNGKQWYDRCFKSLKQSVIPIKTIVVDNASTDDTAEYLKNHFPEIHYIQSDVNLGFGQGNNKGIRYALDKGADYVFLLNQDAWIEPDTIGKLVEIHQLHQEYGILSPMHLNAEKTEIEKGLMHYIADYQITSTMLINDLYFNCLSDVYETKYVNAAAWLLPAKTLETVGGFDPLFFHYGEDGNYMQRVLYHGMKIGLCPKLTICHDTERREIRKVFIDNTFKTVLLNKYADINENQNINSYLAYAFRKALWNFIKLRFDLGKRFISDAAFLMNRKTQIKQSKEQNIKRTVSWL